ncbi:oxaloacetate-decarboxylating malate dehydrogenase [Listeria immobilis]|uniref:oxaloacetate-decarboxylating malate dehydrogenase n=1 Tax=Listeria immobilis TaxID=2713502 RepID=UPI001C89688F|nr:oxaloacetate-decarboxylating malate dehydrogenase [Listeria immobilis]
MKNTQDPFFNKSTAFTSSERINLGLIGTLPAIVHTMEEQLEVEYLKIKSQIDDASKSRYLLSLYNVNRVLYFALIRKYVKELLPLIYTPTIAENVIHFSSSYLWNNDALYLDSDYPAEIETALKNATKDMDNVDLMVITDGEGVLGIGDWGINGLMISLGKMSVYTIAAGINPKSILPVIIDNGTNRQNLLESKVYLGKKQERVNNENYLQYLDKFVEVSNQLYPNVLFHWEDFGRGTAQTILDRYSDEFVTFNDDIQGTGITVVAAVNNALKMKNETYEDQKFVIFGAGTAGIGISEQLKNDMVNQGLSEKEARKKIYLVDKDGLIIDFQINLTKGQRCFARDSKEFLDKPSLLEDIIEMVQPSFLIGVSGQANAFNKKIIKSMLSYQKNPAIFPLSNPSKLAEASAAEILEWTNGEGLVVTGSPSEPVQYGENIYHIGQANNALFYPGLGLGIVTSKASKVTNGMLAAAARSVLRDSEPQKLGASLLPKIEDLCECSITVAKAVFLAAIKEGVSNFEEKDFTEQLSKKVWEARY